MIYLWLSVEDGCKSDEICSSAHSWVSSVAVCRGSDLAASGAANGVVRLWALESESRGIQPLHNYSLVLFKISVLSLVFYYLCNLHISFDGLAL